MTKTYQAAVVLGILVLLLLAGAVGYGQATGNPTGEGAIRLLLVDETKTFSSTMRVGALAGILRKTGMVDVSVELVDVESSYEDPLRGKVLAEEREPYDIIIIIPKGIDDGTVKQIWLVSRFFEKTSPEYAGLAALSGIIDQVFQGVAEAVDVTEDLFPGCFAALYLWKGWLE